MRVAYINGPFRRLPYSRASRSPAVPKSGTLYYPVWLAYAAGFARSQGDFEVDLIDAVARRWDCADLAAYLRQSSPPDLVILDTSTPSIDEDYRTAGELKRAFPRAALALVGTHVTARPDDALAQPGVDLVVRGEYDLTAVELARALAGGSDLGAIAGLSFRDEGRVRHTPDRALIDDLDQLPFVSEVYREFLDPRDYFFAAARYPMTMIITSRGCPHRCGWCLYPQVIHRGKYRRRSAENVAAEFQFIADEMPSIRDVGIEDDLFTGDRARLRDICNRLIDQGNRLPFWCDTRVDLDYEAMRLLKAAGCRLLIVGFESAEQDVLDRIGKGTRADDAGRFMADARRAGLLVHGCFVLGNPGETPRSMHKTLDFARRLSPDTAQFFPMIVYPGTRLYDWAREQGHLGEQPWSDWLTQAGGHNALIDQPGLPARDVLAFCDYARREFYLRPNYVLRKMGQSLRSWSEARRNLKAFRSFARHLVQAS